MPLVQRVLAIPWKRHNHPLLGFLSREEVDALLAAPDRATWSGRRDHALFMALYNTGARVSEIVDLRAVPFTGGRTATLHLHGKGRKERVVPLWKATARQLEEWLADTARASERPLFPNYNGQRMSRSGVASRMRLAVAKAATSCPSLRGRRISPHTLRHTTAMHLLQAGVDITVIALWLGHESPITTHGYVEADLAMKQKALDKLPAPAQGRARFVRGDDLLAFLDGL